MTIAKMLLPLALVLLWACSANPPHILPDSGDTDTDVDTDTDMDTDA